MVLVCSRNLLPDHSKKSGATGLEQIDGFKWSKIHRKKENLKDGRGLRERKPGSRRTDHKEMELLRKTKEEEAR